MITFGMMFIKETKLPVVKVFALAVLLTVGCFNHSFGGSSSNASNLSKLNRNDEQPVNIEADQLYYDKFSDVIHARGNVIITQDQQITADQIVFNHAKEEIYALGNVVLTQPDGSVFYGKEIKLDNVHKNGIVVNFSGRFGKQSLIAAKYGEIINKNVIELNNLVYSPCKICANNFVAFTPLWQVRAASAQIDKDKERISYEDATLELFGYPVSYLPYMTTPMPGAKTKSGFLMPTLDWSGTFGKHIRLVYYQKISDNLDATLGMGLYQKVGNVYDLEVRQRFKNGFYKLFSSLTYTEKFDENTGILSNKKDFRGHYDFRGVYNISGKYLNGLVTLDSVRLSDPTKTYLKKYKFSQDDVLKSDFHFRNSSDSHYNSFRNLVFQDLRPEASNKTTARVLPQLTYIHDKEFENFGVKTHFLVDYTNINRPQGMNYNRVVNIWKLDKNFLSNYGMFWKNNLSVRGDLYQSHFHPITVVSNYHSNVNGEKNGLEFRFHPEYASTFNMPLYKPIGNGSLTIDPTVQFITSPVQSKLEFASNEDSQSPELSTTNLFTANRYNGYDLFESGNRVNYGARALIKTPYFDNISIIGGQTYRFTKNSNFDELSGLSGHRSDYVLRIDLQSNNEWQISDSAKFNNNNLRVNRNEFNISYNQPKYNVNLFHFYIDKGLLEYSNEDSYNQEISFNSSINVHKDWWLEGYVKSKIGKPTNLHTTKMIADGLTLKNSNECLDFEVGLKRDYLTLKDLKPSTTFLFRIRIPTF